MILSLVPVSADECNRIRCGLPNQNAVDLETLYSCSRAGYVGVFSCGSAQCAPFAGEMAAAGLCPSGAPAPVLMPGVVGLPAPASIVPRAPGGLPYRFPAVLKTLPYTAAVREKKLATYNGGGCGCGCGGNCGGAGAGVKLAGLAVVLGGLWLLSGGKKK